MKDRIFPREGTDKDLFERLNEYISYFDKNWTNRVEGATDEEIEKFQNIYKMIDKNFRIPKSLYTYFKNIRMMNIGDDILLSYIDGDCYPIYIENIIDWNEFYLSKCENIDYIILTLFCISDKVLIMDLSKNGQISVIDEDEDIPIVEPIAKTLENLLFKSVFIKYEFFDNIIRIYEYTKDKNIKENVENILKNYDIKRTWFDDGIRYNGNEYYGYGNGVSIYLCFCVSAKLGPGFVPGLRGFITGENKELVEKIYRDIDKCLIKSK